MSETDGKIKIPAAMLTNVVALLEAVGALTTRQRHLDGMGMFYGPSGFGKSVAAAVVSAEMNAVYVHYRSSWTRADFVEAVARRLGVPVARRLSLTTSAIGEELAKTQRPLLVDEADMMFDKGQLEIVRELHMTSESPIVLIGEESFRNKIKRVERIAGRVLYYTGANPATLDDARQLAGMYCRRVKVADDLLAYINAFCHGRVRRVVNNLSRQIEPEAVRDGVEIATRDWWGDRDLDAGEAPNRAVL
ncbi:MAG TPA: ATP-binding protein [Xanthobacteraceae bacterium]|nr:ATP-binding protein [Xanthobacteraceae bacterium]